ncbi:MAG: GMP synthase [Bacteroidota bacterium]
MKFNRINPELGVGATERQHIRVAILDLYNNEPNEGMRCIQQILNSYPLLASQSLSFKVYDVRFRHEVPSMDYDIYISTGGPGSPLEEPGAQWERLFFRWVDDLLSYNKMNESKKHAFFVCHSFQLLCRHLKVGDVCKRVSTAFGIFPIHKTADGLKESCFKGLADPFFAVDSRDWQIIKPDLHLLQAMGAKILAIEKERPHVSYERAVMAIRFTPEIIGTQFHPEADATGMKVYLMRQDKKDLIIRHHGEDKYEEMLLHLNDAEKISLTQQIVFPTFLKNAIATLNATADERERNVNVPVSR